MISAQTTWMDLTMPEHHNSLTANNSSAVTPAAAFRSCSGCSRVIQTMGTFQGPLPHHPQCPRRVSLGEAVTTLSHSSAGLAFQQQQVSAGHLPQSKPQLWEVPVQSSSMRCLEGCSPHPKAKPHLCLSESSHNTDSPATEADRRLNLNRINAGI